MSGTKSGLTPSGCAPRFTLTVALVPHGPVICLQLNKEMKHLVEADIATTVNFLKQVIDHECILCVELLSRIRRDTTASALWVAVCMGVDRLFLGLACRQIERDQNPPEGQGHAGTDILPCAFGLPVRSAVRLIVSIPLESSFPMLQSRVLELS